MTLRESRFNFFRYPGKAFLKGKPLRNRRRRRAAGTGGKDQA
jgi:hypothetical protein